MFNETSHNGMFGHEKHDKVSKFYINYFVTLAMLSQGGYILMEGFTGREERHTLSTQVRATNLIK
jgi:hypothetical protein